jgi:hypothetical protein
MAVTPKEKLLALVNQAFAAVLYLNMNQSMRKQL